MRAWFLLLLLANDAGATCASLSSGVWHCPDTGNVLTNGADLRSFFDAQPYACGDTIILYAGVEYQGALTSGDPNIPLRGQNACKGQKNVFTKIVSSRLSEIPGNVAPQLLTNYYAMMPYLTVNQQAFWWLHAGVATGGANNYSFHGLRFSTTVNAYNNQNINNLGFAFTFDTSVAADIEAYQPRDILVERCIFEGYETGAFGLPTFSNKNGNAFYGSWNAAASLLTNGWTWRRNAFIATGYARQTEWADGDFTATAGNPTIISGTGLHALLGIAYNAGCTNGCDFFTSGGACQGACARVVLRQVGDADDWEDMNGPFYVRARADGITLDVVSPNPNTGATGTTMYDSTGYGAFTFTSTSAQLSKAGQMNQEALYFPAATNVRVYNNWFNSWGNPNFFGGATSLPTLGDKVIQTGSTASSIIVNDASGLYVGMAVAVDMPPATPLSIFCIGPSGPLSGAACDTLPEIQVAIITAINGTTLSVQPIGTQGIDTAPKVGGALRWRSVRNQGIAIRGNALSNGLDTPSADAGKGLSENKQCINCLFDGNTYGGYLDPDTNIPTGAVGPVFYTPTNQSARSPDHSVWNVTYSFNTFMGYTWGGVESASMNFDQICEYFISSTQPCRNNLVTHNMWIGANNYYSAVENSGKGLTDGIVFSHNTITPKTPTTAGYYWFSTGNCNIYTGLPLGDEAGLIPFRISDWSYINNIVGYGSGMQFLDGGTAELCWPNRSTTVKRNVVVDTNNVGLTQGALDAIATDNWARDNATLYTGLFAGPCALATWTNCEVDSSDPSYGQATDGGNPGADVLAVNDHIHGWSESAGLLSEDLGRVWMVNNRGAWSIGSVQAAITFQVFESTPSSGCTVQIFTTRNRSSAHADTPTPAACNRGGSYSQQVNVVTFLAGFSSSLSASTTYFYKITDGSRVMVGEFTTAPAGSGTSNTKIKIGTASALTYSLNSDLSGGTTLSSATSHSVPAGTGTVVYWRIDATGKRGIIVQP